MKRSNELSREEERLADELIAELQSPNPFGLFENRDSSKDPETFAGTWVTQGSMVEFAHGPELDVIQQGQLVHFTREGRSFGSHTVTREILEGLGSATALGRVEGLLAGHVRHFENRWDESNVQIYNVEIEYETAGGPPITYKLYTSNALFAPNLVEHRTWSGWFRGNSNDALQEISQNVLLEKIDDEYISVYRKSRPNGWWLFAGENDDNEEDHQLL